MSLDASRQQSLAEEIIGEIEWEDEVTGYCSCPGIDLHSTPDGERDCRVKLDGVPTISCFHGSCQEAVAEANRQLRRRLGSGGPAVATAAGKPKSPARRRVCDSKDEDVALSLQAHVCLPQLLADHRFTPAEWLAASPTAVPTDPQAHWPLLLSLFALDDVVWAAEDVRHSSATSDRFADRFRSVKEWLQEDFAPGNFTCPATFRPGSHSRCDASIIHRRFFVVESDHLGKNDIGAVFRWLQVDLRLRAIVDTAGKSLHGWFDFPSPEILAELQVILPAMRCDPALFRASQPCRLPGARRGDRYQHLLYLAP
ncbi:MAG: hypothetical protein RL514_3463 [Verrucomicrobiota bacterium]